MAYRRTKFKKKWWTSRHFYGSFAILSGTPAGIAYGAYSAANFYNDYLR